VAFKGQFEVQDLKKKASSCDLCRLLWEACIKAKAENFRNVSFTRVESWLKLNEGEKASLFLCQLPGKIFLFRLLDTVSLKVFLVSLVESRVQRDFQIGMPVVSDSHGQVHFEIMRHWLTLCDNEAHDQPRKLSKRSRWKEDRLPTRLIDVETGNQELVRLWETSPATKGEYIALSHPWGAPPHFCTYNSNLSDHKRGIAMKDLPATFRDAVITTRALGVRYLWIDSICIIQGADGDFHSEAKRMDQVFSSAYCVLAASRSIGQHDGFLKPRKQRNYVALHQSPGGSLFYVCEEWDDFNAHVLGSRLSSRGWVLQEHALARRTIFFTEYQTYWECGGGVRCETGIKMSK
jgi:hypothetical protein